MPSALAILRRAQAATLLPSPHQGHELYEQGDAHEGQHGGDEGALGHDPAVSAVLVAEHGAVGGHGHARQHDDDGQKQAGWCEQVKHRPDDHRGNEQPEGGADPQARTAHQIAHGHVRQR